MNSSVSAFRKKHGCKICPYYKKGCKGTERCVFDFLPFDNVEEEVELFLIS